MVVAYHPRIGHLYVPGIRARIPFEHGFYLVRTNSSGFRADCEFVEGAGRRPRIVVLGDSYAAGDCCNAEERFSERLGEALDADVYNYALSGSGPDQQLLIFEEFVRNVEADLIIWAIAVHTIERITATHRPALDRITGRHVLVPKPYFTLEGGELRLNHHPVPRQRPETSEEQARERTEPRLAIPPVWERVFQHRRLRHARELVNSHLCGTKVRLRSLIYRSAGVQFYDDYRDPTSQGWQLMAALIERLRDRSGNTPLLIVPLPTYHYFVDKLAPVYQPLFESLADERRQLHVYNLSADLVKHPLEQRMRFCFERNTHYSPTGHRQVAIHLAEEIRRRGLLHTRSTPAGSGSAPQASSHPRRATAPRSPRYLLGISCFGHEAAAALVRDGEVIAAVQEGRLTRVLRDRRFPHGAASYCLEEAQIHQNDLAAVVYYQNPARDFEHVIHSLLPSGSDEAWRAVLPSWLLHQLDVPRLIRHHLRYDGLLLQASGPRSQCAAAFYLSPFQSAAVLAVDSGEWSTASVAVGEGRHLRLLKQGAVPHSLAVISAALGRFLGVGSSHEQLVALAQRGEPRYLDTIARHLVDVKDDGSIELQEDVLNWIGDPAAADRTLTRLFGGPPRRPRTAVTKRETDLAKSMLLIFEEAVVRMARYAHQLTGHRTLCLAGDIGLTAASEERLTRDTGFDQIWAHPVAGDAGCAAGAALDAYFHYFDGSRGNSGVPFDSALGPGFCESELRAFLETYGCHYRTLAGPDRAGVIAELAAKGKLVGQMDGRMEFGLAYDRSRSVIGDLHRKEVQDKLRRGIMDDQLPPLPLTPAAAEERDGPSIVSSHRQRASAARNRSRPASSTSSRTALLEKSEGTSTSRGLVQVPVLRRAAERTNHPAHADLLLEYSKRNTNGALVHLDFRLHGEPVVCTPLDAFDCFMRSNLDAIVIGPYLLMRHEQGAPHEGHGAELPPAADQPLSFEDRFACELDKICRRQLDPLRRKVRGSPASGARPPFANAPSRWQDVPGEDPSPATFTVPRELERDRLSPRRAAEAITRQWSIEQVSQAFRPVLARLLSLRGHVTAGVGDG